MARYRKLVTYAAGVAVALATRVFGVDSVEVDAAVAVATGVGIWYATNEP